MMRRTLLRAMAGMVYGGLPARRPDQDIPSSSAGVAPGTASGTFRGRTVVLFGTGPGIGVFEYNGTPAGPSPGPANPPVTYLAPPGATKDPVGNLLPTTGGGVVTVAGSLIGQLISATLRLFAVGDDTPALVSGSGGSLLVSSGRHLLAQTTSTLQLFSSGSATGTAQLVVSTGTPAGQTTALFEVQGTMAAPLLEATVGGLAETWHVVGAGQFLASFSAGGTAPRFQLEPINGGRVRLSGAVNTGAVNPAGTAMFTLPAGYRPARTLNFVTQNNITAYTLGSGSVQVLATGDVQCVPASTAGKFVLLDGICFELD